VLCSPQFHHHHTAPAFLDFSTAIRIFDNAHTSNPRDQNDTQKYNSGKWNFGRLFPYFPEVPAESRGQLGMPACGEHCNTIHILDECDGLWEPRGDLLCGYSIDTCSRLHVIPRGTTSLQLLHRTQTPFDPSRLLRDRSNPTPCGVTPRESLPLRKQARMSPLNNYYPILLFFPLPSYLALPSYAVTLLQYYYIM
jgi:hypothetical protein